MPDNRTVPVLLDGLRTPFGKYEGSLKDVSPRKLGAHTVKALIDRHAFLERPDGVILAQVIQGGQGQNPARQVALSGGVSPQVPAITLNNVCLGGMAAVADAARRIRLGEGSVYLVGGVDSMSRAPHAGLVRSGSRLVSVALVDTLSTDGLWCALDDVSMGTLSDRANAELGIGRKVQDEIALRSQDLAAKARAEGRLAQEIVPLLVSGNEVVDDEGVREGLTMESMAALKPAFVADGSITAGNASQLTDGASIGAVASMSYAEQAGVAPLGRVIAYTEVAGPDATLHLKPARAIEGALQIAGLPHQDIALYEINEAFAGVVEASRRELSIPIDVVNVNGGAIALGHPLGGTGFRLVLTLARELARRGERYGVASMCGGGGQGFAVVIENTQ
jgi:acetyl-CoA C-acetyltransferase